MMDTVSMDTEAALLRVTPSPVAPVISRPEILTPDTKLPVTALPLVFVIFGLTPAGRRTVGLGPPLTLTGTVRATP